MLEEMLGAYVIDFQGIWDKHLALVEFSYNNSFQGSISMVPYEVLYGQKCQTPFCWNEVGESKLQNVEMIEVTSEKMRLIQDKLKTDQKSYAGIRRSDLEFTVGDKVFLKISPWKGVVHFCERWKLDLRFFGPFIVLEKFGLVAYHLELPRKLDKIHNVFHVSMLKKYVADSSHTIEAPPVEL